LDNTIELHDGCRKLSQLHYSYSDAEKYIDGTFSLYEDELDRLADTNFYDDRILADVKTLLEKLTSGFV
jgi:vacuolar-type H+-ATPase subunit E/Vma4